MQLHDYFYKLRKNLDPSTEQTSVSISLSEISEIFDCTSRNAKLVLKKLEKEKWIHWIPGRGRGNQSSIKFLKTIESVRYELAQQHVGNGDLKKALDTIQQLSNPIYRNRFFEWIHTQFGYRREGLADSETIYDTLRFPVFRKIGTLDPAFTGCGIETHLVRHIYDCLVSYDSQLDDFRPQIAHHWESSNDYTVWTFFLRKGAFFHHGREITSEDVVFTFERLKDSSLKSPYRWLFEDVISFEKMGPYCVQVRLASCNSMFLHHISFHAASILPEDLTCSNVLNYIPIGSGPFTITKLDDAVYRFEANSNYFHGRPNIDIFEIWVLEEVKAVSLGREPDEFQLTYLRDSSTSLPCDWQTIDKQEMGCKLLVFNLNKQGVQQDLNFRKAINNSVYPLDLMKNHPTEDLHFASSFLPDMEDEVFTQECKKATHYLDQSNYHGETIKLLCYEHHKLDAEMIQQQCNASGINIELCLVTLDDRLSEDTWRDADLILYQAIFDDDTIFSVLEAFQTSSSFLRICMDRSLEEVTRKRINELKRAKTKKERLQIMRILESEFHQSLAFLYLYRRRQTYYFQPTLKGVVLSALGWVQFKELWVHNP